MAARSYQADPKGTLNPEDYTHFRTQKWRVNDTYNLAQAQNTHEQNSARNERERTLQELTRQFTSQRQGLANGWARRGMMNSGLWQKHLGDFNTARNQAFAHTRGHYQDQLGGLDLAKQQLGTVRTNALSDIDIQQAARRAAVQAMRSGGF